MTDRPVMLHLESVGLVSMLGALDPQSRLVLVAVLWQVASVLVSWLRLQAARWNAEREAIERNAAPVVPPPGPPSAGPSEG